MTMATLMAPTPTTPVSAPTSALLPIYKRAPIELVRGEGIRLFDSADREYIDFTSGIAVNALGYGDADFTAAVREALDSGIVHTSNLFRTRPAGDAAPGCVRAPSATSAVTAVSPCGGASVATAPLESGGAVAGPSPGSIVMGTSSR